MSALVSLLPLEALLLLAPLLLTSTLLLLFPPDLGSLVWLASLLSVQVVSCVDVEPTVDVFLLLLFSPWSLCCCCFLTYRLLLLASLLFLAPCCRWLPALFVSLLLLSPSCCCFPCCWCVPVVDKVSAVAGEPAVAFFLLLLYQYTKKQTFSTIGLRVSDW